MKPREEILIWGRGSHAQVVCDAIKERYPAVNVRFADDAEGGWPAATDLCICAIGANDVRSERFSNFTVIHPSATVARLASIGLGVFIGAKAVIGPGAIIGEGAIINTGAVIEHQCYVGAYAHVASGAVLSGNVQIGPGALIGAGAVIRAGQKVGAWATVGCGAVVVKDVPAGETWVGNPAGRHQDGEGVLRNSSM